MNELSPHDVPDAALPRRVLLLGASGLIGSAVLAGFRAERVDVRAIARRQNVAQDGVEWLAIDLATLSDAADWLPYLSGVDCIVNCAGVLQGREELRAHVDSTRALYEASERAGVRRVLHVSAVGADREAVSEFSAAKRAGEQQLMATSLDWVVLRPAIVVGRAAYGGSAMLRGLAALPFVPVLPGAGLVQAVHLDDLVATIVMLSRRGAPTRLALDVAGAERLDFPVVVEKFRAWLRFGRAPRFKVPRALTMVGAGLGDFVRWLGWRPSLGTVAYRELERGAVGEPAAWHALLGAEPLPLSAALEREPASVQERWFARLYFLKPAVFAVLALFWIGTGLIALGPGLERGLSYLREVGVAASLAPAAVVLGALFDVTIGVGLAVRRTARSALWAAVAVSIFYLVAASVLLPWLWLDPLGPLLKVLPVVVLHGVALAILEDR